MQAYDSLLFSILLRLSQLDRIDPLSVENRFAQELSLCDSGLVWHNQHLSIPLHEWLQH